MDWKIIAYKPIIEKDEQKLRTNPTKNKILKVILVFNQIIGILTK